MANRQNQSAAQSQGSSNYIDLHVSGIGYLSRVREVSVRKGSPFMAATIRAMHGEKGVKDGIQYVPFDVKAATDDTAQVLWNLQQMANDKSLLVMVQFKIGDFYIDSFKYTSGDKAGETGTMLKGRLIKIRNAWVKTKGQGGDQEGWKNVYSASAYSGENQGSPDDRDFEASESQQQQHG